MRGNDFLYGNGGNDWMTGQSGHDSLYGGDGHDTIEDNTGLENNFVGGTGNDLFLASRHG